MRLPRRGVDCSGRGRRLVLSSADGTSAGVAPTMTRAGAGAAARARSSDPRGILMAIAVDSGVPPDRQRFCNGFEDRSQPAVIGLQLKGRRNGESFRGPDVDPLGADVRIGAPTAAARVKRCKGGPADFVAAPIHAVGQVPRALISEAGQLRGPLAYCVQGPAVDVASRSTKAKRRRFGARPQVRLGVKTRPVVSRETQRRRLRL